MTVNGGEKYNRSANAHRTRVSLGGRASSSFPVVNALRLMRKSYARRPLFQWLYEFTRVGKTCVSVRILSAMCLCLCLRMRLPALDDRETQNDFPGVLSIE